ncbi:DUF192 domain-containing protein [Desulfovibrio sp. OttesenSCG-928-I05]|nr:DUF192 domain-containing protein [Desulfovibrio sp. OttesenSCG-928-I05]
MRESAAIACRSCLIAVLAVLFAVCSCLTAQASEFREGRLEITRASGAPVVFSIEIARTLDQRLRGLSYRERMPEKHGMLFDFEENTVMNMWMRNVSIPLDMLFIDEGGVIFRIAPDAVPFTDTVHSSRRPGRYVLCIPAGSVERLGIKRLDTVSLRAYDPVTVACPRR